MGMNLPHLLLWAHLIVSNPDPSKQGEIWSTAKDQSIYQDQVLSETLNYSLGLITNCHPRKSGV